MKPRRQMFQQKLNEIPVTFQDVAACFSDSEWKLLHEWQKELYNNVMKFIQQAMITLGPLIATSVFALAPKGNDVYDVGHQEDETGNYIDQNTGPLSATSVFALGPNENYLYDVGHQEDETGNYIDKNTVDTTANYELSFGINLDGDLYRDIPLETNLRACSNHLSTGPVDMIPNVSLDIKEETATTSTNFHQPSDGGGNSSTLRNTAVSFREDHNQDQSTVASTADAQVATFPLKEDDPSHFMDSLDSKIQENIIRPTDDGGQGYRTKKHSNSAHPNQTHRNSQSGVEQSHSNITSCRWQWCSEQNQEFAEIESTFSASVGSRAHLEAPTLMGLEISGSYNSAEYEKRPMPTKEVFKRRRKYKCKFGKRKRKPRINTSWVQCKYCGRAFNNKENLAAHTRTHTKEKPFACNECEKSYTTKGNLKTHMFMHTGEGGRRRNRRKRHRNSAHPNQTHSNRKSGVRQRHSNISSCRWQWLSETNQELRETDSTFSASGGSRAHLEAPTLMGLDKYNEGSENSAIHQTYQPNTKKTLRSYNSTERDKRRMQSKELLKNRRTYNCKYARNRNKFTSSKPRRNTSWFQCKYCAKKFNHRENFVSHLRTHPIVRPFACNECEKSFTTKGNLNVHKRIHTGVKPFHCAQCEKSFYQKVHLSNHYKAHTVQQTSG